MGPGPSTRRRFSPAHPGRGMPATPRHATLRNGPTTSLRRTYRVVPLRSRKPDAGNLHVRFEVAGGVREDLPRPYPKPTTFYAVDPLLPRPADVAEPICPPVRPLQFDHPLPCRMAEGPRRGMGIERQGRYPAPVLDKRGVASGLVALVQGAVPQLPRRIQSLEQMLELRAVAPSSSRSQDREEEGPLGSRREERMELDELHPTDLPPMPQGEPLQVLAGREPGGISCGVDPPSNQRPHRGGEKPFQEPYRVLSTHPRTVLGAGTSRSNPSWAARSGRTSKVA